MRKQLWPNNCEHRSSDEGQKVINHYIHKINLQLKIKNKLTKTIILSITMAMTRNEWSHNSLYTMAKPMWNNDKSKKLKIIK